MWIQLFLEQVHFGLNILAALVMFGVFWLHLDAWLVRKSQKESFRMVGFFLISLSFLVHSAMLESTLLPIAVLGTNVQNITFGALRVAGYIFIIVSLILDPVQPRPKVKNPFEELGIPDVTRPPKATSDPSAKPAPLTPSSISGQAMVALAAPSLIVASAWGMPVGLTVLAITCGLLYLYRATVGLEKHLAPVAISFLILAVSELLTLAGAFQSSKNVFIHNLVAPFGSIWLVEHILIVMATVIILRWVFGYLLKRFETQLFMIFTTSVVLIYVATTMTFTTLLLQNVQDDALKQLTTDVRVLSYALESKKAETLSDAQVLAQNPQIDALMAESQHTGLKDLVEQYFLSKRQSFLVVVSETGQVLVRGEERDRTGDTLSGDAVIKRALAGASASTIAVREGVLAPELSVRSAVPIRVGGKIIGAVLAGTTVDNAFVDGIKKSTGLESTLYSGNQISATTLVTSDGITRPLGIVESRRDITGVVLKEGKRIASSVTFLGRPHLAAYEPLHDVDNVVVGMIVVGEPQATVLATAARSLQLTFLVAIILLVLSIFPAYRISRYITNQIR